MCWNGWNRARSWAQESGAHFLGLLWGTNDLPQAERSARVPACSERGCPFPRLDGATVCRQHWEQDSQTCSYPRELKLNYGWEAYGRASDDRNINGRSDADFHSGWIGEDKYGFLYTQTYTGKGTNGDFHVRSKGERENDKWWKENVIDKGIEAPGVVVRKTNKELKAEMDAMIEESLVRYTEYSLEQSMENIQKFFSVRKETNPLHQDPFHPNEPRMKIGDGAAVSLKGKMRRGGGHGQGIRKKQRNRAPGWQSSRHNHDPQYFTRETVRGLDYEEFEDSEIFEMPDLLLQEDM